MNIKNMVNRKISIDLIKSIGIVGICTFISLIFEYFKITNENIVMVYLLGVICIVIVTKGYCFGILSSLISVLSINYLFMYPKMTFEIYHPNYLITIAVFIAVSIITSRLIVKLQNQVKIAEKNELISKKAIDEQKRLANEKEVLYKEQEKIKIEVEKEKLRNNLLRSISHDLRTPLTGISGVSSFIIESYDTLDKGEIKNLVADIETDAIWLNKLVENLLNMTRIQDGKLLIKKEYEVVDDIVTEAIRRVQRIKKNHDIKVFMSDKVLLVPMDGKLIIQVLVNLLDNAIKHTNDNSTILIKIKESEEFTEFYVEDNGGGIDELFINHIFKSFISDGQDVNDRCRGIGIGLSICKSIIEAHKGQIDVINNDMGGATFRFILPNSEDNK